VHWVSSGTRDGVNRRAPERRHRASLRAHFLEAMDHVIQEFNLQDSVALTLNLEGDQIRMNRVVAVEGNVAARRRVTTPRASRCDSAMPERGHRTPRDGRRIVSELMDRSHARAIRAQRPDRVRIAQSRQLRGKGRA